MKKNVRYKPSKLNSAVSLVVGSVFIIIGLTMVIPQFGLFGLLWTGLAVVFTVVDGIYLFGKTDTTNLFGGYEITDEEPEEESSEERLKKLQNLYDQRLITTEEYEEKRKEILKDI